MNLKLFPFAQRSTKSSFKYFLKTLSLSILFVLLSISTNLQAQTNCIVSDTTNNLMYLNTGNCSPSMTQTPPPADGSGQTWLSPSYNTSSVPDWVAPTQVTTPQTGNWATPCNISGSTSNKMWIGTAIDGSNACGATNGTVVNLYFRNVFTVPTGGCPITQATLTLSGDNLVTAWLNGTELIDAANEPYTFLASCTQIGVTGIAAGQNVLAFEVLNVPIDQQNYQGLTYEMCYWAGCTPTNTPTNTFTFTPTITPTYTATNTATNTNTFTPSPTFTNSPTKTPTNTATNSATNTCTFTATKTWSNSPTKTPTNTATNTATNTRTLTPTITWTNSPTKISTNTATNTNTATLTFTRTNSPTITPTSTPTNTRTCTATNTPTYTPGTIPFCGYVAYSHGGLSGYVAYYTNNAWVSLGNASFSNSPDSDLSLAFWNCTPYVAFRNSGNTNAYLEEYTGSGWSTVGNVGYSLNNTYFVCPSLVFSTTGTPYVYFGYQTGTTYVGYVMDYNGSAWVTVGPGSFGAIWYDTSLVLNNNVPFVAFTSTNLVGLVETFNGTNWVTVGGGSFGTFYNNTSSNPSLAFSNGVTYVAYTDANSKGWVKYVNSTGTAWLTLGGSYGTEYPGGSPDLVFSNGNPYVAFTDGNEMNWVMEYNGTAWVTIGNSSFAKNYARTNLSLAIETNGTPYVAYNNYTNNYGYVAGFNGSAWVTVGNTYYGPSASFCAPSLKLCSQSCTLTGDIIKNASLKSAFQQGQFNNTSTPTPSPTITPGPTSPQIVAAPNLSRGGVPIKFLVDLSEEAKINLTLYTVTGEVVYNTTVHGAAENNSLTWDLKNQWQQTVASGLYIYLIQVNDSAGVHIKTGKVVVIH